MKNIASYQNGRKINALCSQSNVTHYFIFNNTVNSSVAKIFRGPCTDLFLVDPKDLKLLNFAAVSLIRPHSRKVMNSRSAHMQIAVTNWQVTITATSQTKQVLKLSALLRMLIFSSALE